MRITPVLIVSAVLLVSAPAKAFFIECKSKSSVGYEYLNGDWEPKIFDVFGTFTLNPEDKSDQKNPNFILNMPDWSAKCVAKGEALHCRDLELVIYLNPNSKRFMMLSGMTDWMVQPDSVYSPMLLNPAGLRTSSTTGTCEMNKG